MTSAVITPEIKDTTPSLTVTISKLSSSSPFPSPGSPFLPPPIPSAHEYALITPSSKRRSTDSRMNVGSKSDHESPPQAGVFASTHHPINATTATVGNTTSSSPALDKRRESADITNGSGNANGLTASFSRAPEFGKPDSKPTVNGQATATPTIAKLSNTVGAEAPPEDALSAKTTTPSTQDDDDDTSVSPATATATAPLSGSNSQKPPAADDDECTATNIIDAAKPYPDNNLKRNRHPHNPPRDSLSSSRPAPPSPADSRRASATISLSRHSSTRSRPGSTPSLTPANTNTNTHETEAATTPTTPTQQQQQQQQQKQQHAARKASTSSLCSSPAVAVVPPPPPPPPPPPILPVKIRDFAFPDEDARHIGTGPLTPRPNRKLQRPLSTWSASSASSATGSDDHDHDDGAGVGGSSSSYNFAAWGLGRLGWFGARGGAGAGAGDDGPSQGDFARNFTDAPSPEYEIDDPYDSLDNDDDDDDDDDGDGEGDDDGGRFGGAAGADGERSLLLPGLYRALYAFEPEGTAEMALEEDQVVRVVGRGGGVGWAIVARGEDEGHALVPEGYLELVSLDRDQEGEDEG